jgi:translation initiation factor 5A
MSDDADYEVNTGDAGAALTVSVEAGQIRKGGYIMIKGKACKVKDVSVSKTGKHGHAKCKFAASDIFTGATCEELCPSTHSIDVPVVTKSNWMITGLEGDYVMLMNDEGDMREDLQLPTAMGFSTADDVNASKLIKEYCQMVDDGAAIDILCTVLSAIKIEKIVDIMKKDAA